MSTPQAVRIDDCVGRWTKDFPSTTTNDVKDNTELEGLGEPFTVAVTGTTGSLGSYILSQLLQDDAVTRVYALNRVNREHGTFDRQVAAFEERRLDVGRLRTAEGGGRVRFRDVDLADKRLGLSAVDYDELRSNITHLIHNAWELNFLYPLDHFERVHIAGTRHLIDLVLSTSAASPPTFIFFSSIATVANTPRDKTPVVEDAVVDASVAFGGYGESKLVGERICAAAAKERELRYKIVRIGQVAGATDSGYWSKNEYIPILFRSCAGLGKIPEDFPPVRWLPVDICASAALKIAFHPLAPSAANRVYQLENPTTAPWSAILSALLSFLSYHSGLSSPSSPLTWVPVDRDDWIEELYEVDPSDNAALARVPAVLLTDFFESLEETVPLAVERTRGIAPEVDFGEVREELVHRYLAFQRI